MENFVEKEIRDIINKLADDSNPVIKLLAGISGYQQEQIGRQQEEIVLQKEQITFYRETIQVLRDEIARLKGMKPKPLIKPSQLEKGRGGKKYKNRKKKRAGSSKRSKTSQLTIP